MKKFTIILLSLLVATQAFAFGKNERNVLLGFGAGVIVTHLINKHNADDTHYNSKVMHEKDIVYTRPHKVYKEKHYVKNNHKKKHFNKHYRKSHRKHHDNMVVVNRYRTHHYY